MNELVSSKLISSKNQNLIKLPPVRRIIRPPSPLSTGFATSTSGSVAILSFIGKVLTRVDKIEGYIFTGRINPCHFGFGNLEITEYNFIFVINI